MKHSVLHPDEVRTGRLTLVVSPARRVPVQFSPAPFLPGDWNRRPCAGRGCGGDRAGDVHRAAHLVIVGRNHPGLYACLERFSRDAQVLVILDRRSGQRRQCSESCEPERRRADRRGAPGVQHDLRLRPIIVCRKQEATSMGEVRGVKTPNPEVQERTSMGDMGPGEDRQRIDRWVEESQYLIGRLIPTLLDDRERLKGVAEATEQDNEKLRQDLGHCQAEISELESEKQHLLKEQAALAEAFMSVMDHMNQMHKPLTEILRRLQLTQPVSFNTAS